MNDIDLTRNSELMVVQASGNSDAGIEFLDAYLGNDVIVVDSGRIVVPESAREELVSKARANGLTVAVEVPSGRTDDYVRLSRRIPRTSGNRAAILRSRLRRLWDEMTPEERDYVNATWKDPL